MSEAYTQLYSCTVVQQDGTEPYVIINCDWFEWCNDDKVKQGAATDCCVCVSAAVFCTVWCRQVAAALFCVYTESVCVSVCVCVCVCAVCDSVLLIQETRALRIDQHTVRCRPSSYWTVYVYRRKGPAWLSCHSCITVADQWLIDWLAAANLSSTS